MRLDAMKKAVPGALIVVGALLIAVGLFLSLSEECVLSRRFLDVQLAVNFCCLFAFVGGLSFVEGASWIATPRFRNWLYGKVKKQFPEDAEQDEKEDRVEWRTDWLPQLMGRMEVAGYTTLFAFSVPGAGGFVAGWIALKMATGWNRFTRPERYYRRMAMGALLVNLVNVGFGLLGAGLYRLVSSIA